MRNRIHFEFSVGIKFSYDTIGILNMDRHCIMTHETKKLLTAWKLLLDSVDMIVHEVDTLSESNMLQGC